MGLLDHIRPIKLVSFPIEVSGMRFTGRAITDLRDEARASAMRHAEHLESYLVQHPDFKTSYVPIPVADDAPPIVQLLSEASEKTHAGPMVGLPGAIAESIAWDLHASSKEVVISGEGDVFMIGDRDRTFMVEPPHGEGTTGIAVRVHCRSSCAFYTSTGRVNVPAAIGLAHSVAVIADKGALAGSAASAIAYEMHRPDDLDKALTLARNLDGVTGALVVVDGAMGVWGEVEIVSGITT